MNFDELKFEESIKPLERVPYIGLLSSAIREWGQNVGIPEEILRFLNKYCYSSHIRFGNNTFNSPNELKWENEEEQNWHVYKKGLLIIGSGLNGDPVVINMKNGNVGFLCHDELWELEEEPNLSEIYQELNESIGSFYYQSMFSSEFPVDYYSSLEYVEKIA